MGELLDWLFTALAYLIGGWLWVLLILTVAALVAMPVVVLAGAWQDRR